MAEVSRLNQGRANEREETVDERTGGWRREAGDGRQEEKKCGRREGQKEGGRE